MTCERVEEQLSALIDNELEPQTRAAITEHLRACPGCARLCRDLQLVARTSAELEFVAPPDHLYATIRRNVRNIQHRPRFAVPRIGWVLVPALATVVLMLVVFPREKASLPAASRVAQSDRGQAVEPSVAVAPEPSATEPAPSPKAAATRVPRPRTRRPATVAGASTERRDLTSVQPRGEPDGSGMVRMVSAVAPAGPPAAPTADALSSLHQVQQALEEIEAALHQNPGNPQVVNAYRATYQKGVAIKDRYLLGAR